MKTHKINFLYIHMSPFDPILLRLYFQVACWYGCTVTLNQISIWKGQGHSRLLCKFLVHVCISFYSVYLMLYVYNWYRMCNALENFKVSIRAKRSPLNSFIKRGPLRWSSLQCSLVTFLSFFKMFKFKHKSTLCFQFYLSGYLDYLQYVLFPNK